MSREVPYPENLTMQRSGLIQAGRFTFAELYGLEVTGLPSIIIGNHTIDVLTYTQQPDLLLFVGQPYAEIVVMATVDIAQAIVTFRGWEYEEEIRNQFYPPKRVAGKLANYIHASRLKHMSLLEDLLDLKPFSSEGI